MNNNLAPKITVVILNYDRPDNVENLILPFIEKYQSIDEIIISHGKESTSFNYTSVHCRIVHRHDWGKVDQKYGVARRFLAALDAKNNTILMLDDDVLLPEETLNQLHEMSQQRPEIIHGLTGKTFSKAFKYWPNAYYGDVPVVLTSCALFPKHLIEKTVDQLDLCDDFFKDNTPKVHWNGEDIFISLVAVKLNNCLNKAYPLDYSSITELGGDRRFIAISSTPRDHHYSHRTQFVRYLVRKFELQKQLVVRPLPSPPSYYKYKWRIRILNYVAMYANIKIANYKAQLDMTNTTPTDKY